MKAEGAGIRALICELSRQHACDGHIDITLAQRLASELASAGSDIDALTLRSLVMLQSFLITDLRTVLEGAPDARRVDEVLAIQSAIRAYIG